MSKKASRIVILICALSALILFALFLKDILVPFIRMEVNNDVDGAKELLRSKGILGFLTVALVEALQMVVVFIPAEFIQISSGLSYPLYIALILCDLGVCLGASIIFVLVRTFRIQNESFEKRKKTITRLAAKKGDKNTVLFMLLLFIMPLIPFGAICYYGSSTKIKYRNYILAVAGGVIPSILTSNLMGAAGKAFIRDSIPLWLLILIIVLLASVLFVILFFFINKFFLKESNGTPDSPVYALFFKIMRLLCWRKFKVTVESGLPDTVKAPYFALFNHQCFFDIYFTSFVESDTPSAIVANEYFLYHIPMLRRLPKKCGAIPKKLFTNDFVTPVGIMRMLKKGYPVVIFPEGRLTPDGKTNPIPEQSGRFYKKLGYDIVLFNISGAYFGKPKWRKKRFKTKVQMNVRRVIKAEELDVLTEDEVNDIINSAMEHDASEEDFNIYRRGGKAKGLENVLYRCIDCGALYTTSGKGNTFRCSSCGKEYHINEHYRFDEMIDGEQGTISRYYAKIKEAEKAGIDSLDLRAEVRTVIFDANVNKKAKEKGECRFTAQGFEYRSESTQFFIPASLITAIPFSCGTEFETYYKNELYYFYPVNDPVQTARWGLISDIIKEMNDSNER
ncbi:MAG: VTT domain-containing protein [Clostridia bacterium]|nr:VTT domain-containing protein [Clostridia bacterium]